MPYTNDKTPTTIIVLQTHLSKWVWYPELGVVDRKLKGERKINETISLDVLRDTEQMVLTKVLQRELKIMSSFNAV